MRVATVVGARPQFVKAGAVSRELRRRHEEVLIHTGQHFDDEMSAVFFRELALPRPDHDLGVGSGPHGRQTGAMLARIEEVLLARRFDWVMVYGDTNSTLAGALAASKLHLPLAHVEAGLRSFNRRMPEEQNRLVADHLSDCLLCPGEQAVRNLVREGIERGVHQVGDVMADALRLAAERAGTHSTVLERFELVPGRYSLVTVHRAENTDDPQALGRILDALERVEETLVFPVHPRTRKAMEQLGRRPAGPVRCVEPVGYLDMVELERQARLVLTDSGGVQKEAYWLGVPCITLRQETEWVETVERGWNRLAGTDPERILAAVRGFTPPAARPPLYGDGRAAVRCVEALEGSTTWKPNGS